MAELDAGEMVKHLITAGADGLKNAVIWVDSPELTTDLNRAIEYAEEAVALLRAARTEARQHGITPLSLRDTS